MAHNISSSQASHHQASIIIVPDLWELDAQFDHFSASGGGGLGLGCSLPDKLEDVRLGVFGGQLHLFQPLLVGDVVVLAQAGVDFILGPNQHASR